MRRFLATMLFVSVVLSSLLAVAPAQAAQRTRCFTETNHCISGAILDYWERNGGLAIFGYPISDVTDEANWDGWSGPTQWFQRDRLEDHGAQGVMAGRLGAQILELQGTRWEDFPTVSGAEPGCRYFPQTKHSVCGRFLTYWEQNGGLERFGYPITQEFDQITAKEDGPGIQGLRVQYFERRRMEYHPENAGTQYEVLLGLLGRDIHERGGCFSASWPLKETAEAYRSRVGCPVWSLLQEPIGVRAVQLFERGTMVWVQGGYRQPNLIYVVFYDQVRRSLVWQEYVDTWYEGMPESGGEKPPQGLVEPIRGFGKLWRENPEVRNTLGWAIVPEQPDNGIVQRFTGGVKMLFMSSSDRVLVLFPTQLAEEIDRIRW